MATLAQLRTRIDTWVANRWPTIVARQENYRTNRGHYWQGLRTHIGCPAHSNSTDGDKVGDNLESQPTDAFSNWTNVFPEWVSELLPCCLWVDVYDGPSGKGWVANIEVIYNGKTYHRAVNVGPESSRSQGWHEVIHIPI